MRYEKGTFTVVPNREILRGLPATTQALFIWLCSYADDNGQCYPSRERLANDIGATLRTVDTHLKKLEELQLVTKEYRILDNTQTSNLYQLNVVEGGANIARGGAKNSTRGGAKKDTGGGAKNSTQNYNQ